MKLSSIAVTLSLLSMIEGRMMGLRSIHHRHQVPASAHEVGTGLPNRTLRGEEPPLDGSQRHKQITDKQLSFIFMTLDERELRKKKKTKIKKVCCPVSMVMVPRRPLQLTHMICPPPLSLYLSYRKRRNRYVYTILRTVQPFLLLTHRLLSSLLTEKGTE